MIVHASHSYSPPEYNVIAGIQCDVPLVLVTRMSDFKFNEELNKLDNYILVNMCEWGWDFKWEKTPIFGKNAHEFTNLFPGEEWKKLIAFVESKQPILTFQRELMKSDVTDNLVPIDYPFYGIIPPVQTKDQYYSRPINFFNYWGRSSEYRVKTHADVWLESSNNGASICDNIYYVEKFLSEERNPNKWVSLNIPHFSRIDLSYILNINGLSKISLSQSGCGKKCFRSSESPINSLMLMEINNLAWQFNWEYSKNCLGYNESDSPVKVADWYLKNLPMHTYEMYVACVENSHNYQINNYTKRLESIIQKACG